jgi:hypothetical protein
LGVCLGGLAGVMACVYMVAVGDVRVMRGFFVSAGVVMLRRLLVMTCRVFVMLRRFPVMLCRFLRHQDLLSCERQLSDARRVCTSATYAEKVISGGRSAQSPPGIPGFELDKEQ